MFPRRITRWSEATFLEFRGRCCSNQRFLALRIPVSSRRILNSFAFVDVFPLLLQYTMTVIQGLFPLLLSNTITLTLPFNPGAVLTCSCREMAGQEIRYRARYNRTWLHIQIPDLLSHGSSSWTTESPYQGGPTQRWAGYVYLGIKTWSLVHVDLYGGTGIQSSWEEDCVSGRYVGRGDGEECTDPKVVGAGLMVACSTAWTE